MTETKELMTPTEVGKALRVDAKTVTRWAERGLIRSIKTPGGHTRLFSSDVDRIINGESINDATETGTSDHWEASV